MNDENFKEYQELIRAIYVGAKSIEQASEDGKLNFKDIPVMIPFITSAVKGFTGVEKVLPVITSVDPEVVSRREQIFKQEFNLDTVDPVVEAAIENIILSLMAVYSNIRILMNRKAA